MRGIRRRLTQTRGSRWMGVQGGDDKKQPLRRDGITTIQRRTRALPSLAFTPAHLDLTLIPPRIIAPPTRSPLPWRAHNELFVALARSLIHFTMPAVSSEILYPSRYRSSFA